MSLLHPGQLQVAASVFAVGLALSVAAPGLAGERSANQYASPQKKSEAGAHFFNEPVLRVFRFEVADAALTQLRQTPRSYVTGKVIEGGHVLTNVAIRLRGNGSFRALDERPNFAVKLDEFSTNQTYRGLTKLMFNNSVQDETYFAEFLATQLFRDADVPAARVTHVKVQLNGRDLGLYVVIEAMNKEFLKQHFRNANGNFYEAPFRDIDLPLEQDSGTRGDQSDRVKLFQVCSFTNRAERWRELHKVLDVDRFVSFAAVEMLTAHWDGYVLHTNNYRLYHDPRADKFVFIPHGMDWAFLRPNLSIRVPLDSIVAHAVFGTPQGQKLYRERIGTLFTNLFQVSAITNCIEAEMAKIRTGTFSSNQLVAIERGAALMCERIIARARRISEELADVHRIPLKFDTNNFALLTEWRADHDGGTGAVDRVTIDGKEALHIAAAGAYYHPSWRSLVYLPRGSYRFEGTLRIAAQGPVVGMLRRSGASTSTTFGSATDWRALSYDFEVRGTANDVELVCDFSGANGEAWFDLTSLRVRRLTP